MKLKQITLFLFTVFTVAITLGSCNDDSTTYSSEAPSANAQLYSMKLSAIERSGTIDSVTYPVLATTVFSIDQLKANIYNADSLPYRTYLKNYAATFTYENPSKIEIVYRNAKGDADSIAAWTTATTDSIDFSLYPKIRVTAEDGTTTRDYTVDIRIHKIDPDTTVWTNMTTAFQLPSAVRQQKTLLKGTTFHTFSIDSDNSLYLYTIGKTATSPSSWTKQAITTLPTTVTLDNITLFNDKFYAVDAALKSYSSTNGVTWTEQSSNIHSILGVLPEKEAAKDSLLVVVRQSGKYVFAKTLDLINLKVVENVSNNPFGNELLTTFPSTGFSSVTNYNRDNLNQNILTVTGGYDFTNTLRNQTWSLRSGTNRLEVVSNQSNATFAAAAGIPTFMYNKYLHALTKNVLYKTDDFGSKWIKVPSKEVLDPKIPQSSGQSVIVDSENYIWIFGGVSGSTQIREVWRGRLNMLNPK